MSGIKKLLITSTSFSKVDQEPIDLLKKNNFLLIWKKGPFNDEKLASIIEDSHAIIVGNDIVGQKTLNKQKNLRFIVKHGVGTDNINMKFAEKKGIKVIKATHTNSIAVAEHVFACLLSLIRKVCESRISLYQGKWEGVKFVGSELYGKNLGIIGMGSIGQEVARIGNGFGMEIYYYDIIKNNKNVKAKILSLEKLLEISDILTIHVPLSKSTKNLIDTKEIIRMKSSAYLVNMARGGIINEEALFNALKENKIRGAVLDVFMKQPVEKDWRMLELKNILCTPHIAGYTVESMKRTSLSVALALVESFKLYNNL